VRWDKRQFSCERLIVFICCLEPRSVSAGRVSAIVNCRARARITKPLGRSSGTSSAICAIMLTRIFAHSWSNEPQPALDRNSGQKGRLKQWQPKWIL
jgi:hypothetical protein